MNGAQQPGAASLQSFFPQSSRGELLPCSLAEVFWMPAWRHLTSAGIGQFSLFHKSKVKEKENRADANGEFVNGCLK
jgi:hypothetical protein